jgi:hypothetical protein
MSQHLQKGISRGKAQDVGGKNQFLPIDVQQACLLWVQQIERSSAIFYIDDNLQNYILLFLQQHLTHWLEALSVMGKVSQSINILVALETVVKVRLFLLAFIGVS